MEICVDSVESAINAQNGGAKRVELCAALVEGGITPSIGMFRMVKSRVTIPVFVMIRPRAGDFLYSDDEVHIMKDDITTFKSHGADGFVFGCLNSDGTVNKDLCTELIGLSRPAEVTFHRAIDMTNDITAALNDVIECGFDRVLTSGGRPTVLEGLPVIANLVKQAQDRLIVVPGGGINDFNLSRILKESKVKEFHGSARTSRDSRMTYRNSAVTMGGTMSYPEYCLKVTDASKVKSLISISNELNHS